MQPYSRPTTTTTVTLHPSRKKYRKLDCEGKKGRGQQQKNNNNDNDNNIRQNIKLHVTYHTHNPKGGRNNTPISGIHARPEARTKPVAAAL